VSVEALLAAGYATFLVASAFVIEWLSAHTHRRSLRYRTAGFTYHDHLDAWECPEGEHLLPYETDHERRLARYRARAHVCNRCPSKRACTDSDRGREVVRPLDPWPHSEAGRFHRGLSLVLVGLAELIVVIGLGLHHQAPESLLLGGVFVGAALAARRLARDFVAHPVNFPAASLEPGLRTSMTDAAGPRPRSRWASQNRTSEGGR
jgi:hypothetical protein